jgi:transcriptional regulator with XRE-family HTH domain
MSITAVQTVEARKATGLSQLTLSEASGVTLKAIEEFEAGTRPLNSTTQQGLRAALERAGWGLAHDGRLQGLTIDPRKQGLGDELE